MNCYIIHFMICFHFVLKSKCIELNDVIDCNDVPLKWMRLEHKSELDPVFHYFKIQRKIDSGNLSVNETWKSFYKLMKLKHKALRRWQEIKVKEMWLSYILNMRINSVSKYCIVILNIAYKVIINSSKFMWLFLYTEYTDK